MAMTEKGKLVLRGLVRDHGKDKAAKIMANAIKRNAPGSKSWYEQEVEGNRFTEALAG